MRNVLGELARAVNRAPVPYVGRQSQGTRWAGAPQRGNTAVQMDAMEASAAVFGIVNRTSTAVAKEQWHLHRKTPGQPRNVCPICECENVILVDRHPALVALNKPNEFYTQQEYFESGQQHIDLTGEGWTAIYRVGNIPIELWNLRPDRVVVVTSQDKFLTGYIYLGPDGQEVPIRKEDMLSIRMPHPKDPYRGLGPVQTVLANVTGDAMSAEWNANFFRNGARPGGIVKLSRNMRDDEFDQLVDRFNSSHKGLANAGRTAFLEDGDWIDVKQQSIRDMQYVESANLNRDTIMLAYTASKFDVGILEDVNRASSEAAKADFAERLTVPRLDRWKGMLNNDYLPQFGDTLSKGYEFVYSNPVPADRTSEREDKTAAVQNYKTLIDSGVDPADAARVCGLPEMIVRERPVAA